MSGPSPYQLRPKTMDGAPDFRRSAAERFHGPLFPSREPASTLDVTAFRSKLKRAMSRALKECALSRAEVAARMAEALGQESFSLAMLNAYTAESKDTHDIGVLRFKAFARATGAAWLWDLCVADEGMLVLVGEEARLAEIACVQQQRDELNAAARGAHGRTRDDRAEAAAMSVHLPQKYSLGSLAREAEREQRKRREVYPRMVHKGQMRPTEAEMLIEQMGHIAVVLHWLDRNGEMLKRFMAFQREEGQ